MADAWYGGPANTGERVKYVEPTGEEKAGLLRYKRPPSTWDIFQKEEGIPIWSGIGISDSRTLPREHWERMGALGTYIQLIGTNNSTGMFVLEVPARSATRAHKHFYEERYIVVEGRGSTEVDRDGSSAKTTFEWQPWSMFSIPLNATFRIVNATSSPAVLIGINTAPIMTNLMKSKQFLFENPYVPDERFGGNLEDYWKPQDEFEAHPVQGRAMLTSNLFPDISNCYLPLDNNRGPGYRWVNPNMAGNTVLTGGFIAEYPSGRYSKAHHHGSGPVLICVKGKGYSYTWPKDEGTMTPWANGKGDLVQRLDYGPGGMISAAPGYATWFHQHFAISKEPFRVHAIWANINVGGGGAARPASDDGMVAGVGAEITEGGTAIPYHMEDPYIREYYQSRLKENGAEYAMPPEIYTPAGSSIKIDY
ncbi:MAG: cupin [Dehalococcoidia bacterium]|nr:cupin [Dehalococcoidia bacterium]